MRNLFLTLSITLLATGCFGDISTNGGNIDDNGGGGGGGGGEGGGGAGGGPTGPNCGQVTFPIKASNANPPNVKLVVDGSGSMSCNLNQDDCYPAAPVAQQKWTLLKNTMSDLLGSYSGKAAWGLSVFPKPGSFTYYPETKYYFGQPYTKENCTPGANELSIAKGTESAILSRLAQIDVVPPQTVVGTPTGRTMKALINSSELRASDRNNYVILLSDGLPTCTACQQASAGMCTQFGEDYFVKEAITGLYNSSPSVRTFVIGFGKGTSTTNGANGPAMLSSWAEAGHTDRAGASKYYQAGDAAELASAFDEIVGGAVSCNYRLEKTPDDSSNMIPYIDNVAVPRSASNGFTYESGTNSIDFHGTACTKLRNGAKRVDVIYGCPSEVIM